MGLSRLAPPEVAPAGSRPRWLTSGLLTLALLCALIVLVGMLSPRLGRTAAGVTFLCGLGLLLLAAAFFVGATRRLAARFAVLSGAHAAADAAVVQLRRIGLPLLGLGFFLAWTFVFIGFWWTHPDTAVTGLVA